MPRRTFRFLACLARMRAGAALGACFAGPAVLTLAAAPALAQEHAAAMALVPVDQATHVAEADGDWSDPGTWQGGLLPGEQARVHVPAGRQVRYDLPGSPGLDWIRVDGTLRWATTVDTLLRVDTLVSMGTLEVGTAQAPIAQGAHARIVFTDTGPLDPAADPSLLGRGLIAMGRVRMWGAARLPRFVALAEDAPAGSASLTLLRTPRGWEAGDPLVVVGTRYTGVLYTLPMTDSEDELRSLVALQDGVLALDAPLQFDHAGVPGEAWARPHVANLGCNLTLASEQGAATPVPRRGHVMLMHQDVHIENACFEHLGRTDKRIPVDDPVQNLDGSPGTGSNPRGRYSVHVHRAGTDHAANWMQRPATLRGCVVRGSPGWGVAVHRSHVVVEDCASFDVFGAHFVTEDGNEQGGFRRNIAIHAPGDIAARGYKDGTANHDLAHSGCGFWMQGRDFAVEDNVAAGMGDAGFCWFHRSQVFHAGNPVAVHVENLSRPMQQLLHLRPPIVHAGVDHGDFAYNDVPISQVRDNLAYASGTGHRVTKANPVQLGDQFSVLTGLRSFATDEALFHEYTRHYYYEGLRAVGNQPDNPFRNGITSFALADHLVFRDARVSGFGNCLRSNQWFEGEPDVPNLLLVDPVFTNCLQDWEGFAPANPQGSAQVIADSSSLSGAPPVFLPDPAQSWTLATNPGAEGGDFVLRGTLLDDSGEWPLALVWPGPFLALHIAEQGYHRDAEGNRVLRLQTRLHGRDDPLQTIDVSFLVHLPQPYGNTLGPDNGPLPPAATNLPPTAMEKVYELSAAGEYRIDVPAAEGLLQGASDPEGAPLQVMLAQLDPPRYGALSVAPDGSFMYRREERSHALDDTFGYRVHDTRHASPQATVTLRLVAAPQVFQNGFEVP